MDSIESDYTNLQGVLPKADYQELGNDVLGELLRKLNPEELKRVSGDVFGRIYEYFLTNFAGDAAHDGGEFFTPISLVSFIAHVLDPDSGTVLDPACGSGGMFVQSARTIEEKNEVASERLTFRGLEKNSTTIRLAKMNLAVHGLEGDIQKAITFYEDPQELVGKADYVMANPPFNVDEIDAEKITTDPRLTFGLPSVNQSGKVSTAGSNYVWMSYFYSYLNETGRAGFVMSSQASSAGNKEAEVRKALIETGDVTAMVAIRSGFFYTRTVPCELWFLDRDPNGPHRDKVLMLDARNVNRKVTRKIYDFSSEQEKNLLAIFWLYRDETDRFLGLVSEYLGSMIDEGLAAFAWESDEGEKETLVADFSEAIQELREQVDPFLQTQPDNGPHADVLAEFDGVVKACTNDSKTLEESLKDAEAKWNSTSDTNTALHKLLDDLEPLAEAGRDFIRHVDSACKLAARLIDVCEKECIAKESDHWASNKVGGVRKKAESARRVLVDQLKKIRYFWRQAHWLTSRFPEAELCDVDGLVRLVDHEELEANEWSLTPGRYVGVAPEEVDEDFDFEEAIQNIHSQVEDLNDEAAILAAKIKENFESLGA